MTDHPSNRQPRTLGEHLEIIDDALFESELLEESDLDAADAERAAMVIRTATAQALAASPPVAQEPPARDDAKPSQELPRAARDDIRFRRSLSQPPPTAKSSTPSSAPPSRSFVQKYGLHPAAACLLVVLNLVLTGVGVASLGPGFVLKIPVAPIAAGITLIVQWKWYGDNATSAFTKGLVAALLTAIPLPLAPFVLIPAGIIGFFRRKRVETQVDAEAPSDRAPKR